MSVPLAEGGASGNSRGVGLVPRVIRSDPSTCSSFGHYNVTRTRPDLFVRLRRVRLNILGKDMDRFLGVPVVGRCVVSTVSVTRQGPAASANERAWIRVAVIGQLLVLRDR